MVKRTVTAAVLSAFLASAAVAQAPGDANQCVQAAYELAQAAESKQLTNDKLDKIEDMLNKMEDLCDSDKVAEAMQIAKDIEDEINAQ